MKNDLILLAELLANDDNFALEFSSKQSVTEKFELAKSKFNNLNEDEFEKFLAVLQSLEKVNQKLSLEEMEKVSGGVGNNKLKLAALTFLGITLAPMATSATVSAEPNEFYSRLDRYENSRNINNSSKAEMQLDYYYKIYSETIKNTIEKDESVKKDKSFSVNDIDYKFDSKTMKHIKYGDYNGLYATHKSGGHTKATLKLLDEIITKKLDKYKTNNYFCNEFNKEVLDNTNTAYKLKKKYKNGVETYTFYDSEETFGNYKKQTKTMFPEYWFDDVNDGDRLMEIAKACIEKGTRLIDLKSKSYLYVANINGVVTATVVKEKTVVREHKVVKAYGTILTIYPLELQENNGTDNMYDFTSYSNIFHRPQIDISLRYDGMENVEVRSVDVDFNSKNKETQTNPATPTTPVIQANKEIPKDLKKIDNNTKEEHGDENSSNNKRKSADAEDGGKKIKP